jgi:hypothetical protein
MLDCSALYIGILDQLYLLLQHIFAIMNYFQLVILVALMVLPHIDRRFLLRVGILHHLVKCCGSSLYLIIGDTVLHRSEIGITFYNLHCTI